MWFILLILCVIGLIVGITDGMNWWGDWKDDD